MDWGPDGRLYGPRWFNNEVVSVDVDTGDIRKEASGFIVPAAVKFNSKGELFVLDTGAGKGKSRGWQKFRLCSYRKWFRQSCL